jgi:hypothetical protein
MPYSVIVDGRVLDFRYEKLTALQAVNFYIGDIFIGQIFKMRAREWSVVSFHTPDPLCPVDGFATRYHASEFLLKVCGFRKRDGI